jgi:hypothetical protein
MMMAELHRPRDPDGVADELLLDSLATWTPGTAGHANEQRLIRALNALCKEFGYAGTRRMAVDIEQVWRSPGRAAAIREANAGALDLMDRNAQVAKGKWSGET